MRMAKSLRRLTESKLLSSILIKIRRPRQPTPLRKLVRPSHALVMLTRDTFMMNMALKKTSSSATIVSSTQTTSTPTTSSKCFSEGVCLMTDYTKDDNSEGDQPSDTTIRDKMGNPKTLGPSCLLSSGLSCLFW